MVPSSKQPWNSRLTFGTYCQTGSALKKQISTALALGFTQFDTAQLYHNGASVAKTLKDHQMAPNVDKLFVTTKIMRHDHPHKAVGRINKSISYFGGKVDRFLLHRPMPCEQYQLLEQFAEKGTVSEIGVSNFSQEDLQLLLKVAKVKPVVNQIEFHPFRIGLREMLDFCRKEGVKVQGHTVLAQGKFMAFGPLVRMANRKQMTPAQVLLRFALDNGVDAVVNSKEEAHLEELIDAAKVMDPVCRRWSLIKCLNGHVVVPMFIIASIFRDLFLLSPIYLHLLILRPMLRTDVSLISKESSVGSGLEQVSDAALSLPSVMSARKVKEDPVSLKIATLLFPGDENPALRLSQTVQKLKSPSLEKAHLFTTSEGGKSCAVRKSLVVADKDVVNQDETSKNVTEPPAMPVNIAPGIELTPFFQFVASDAEIPTTGATFVRGSFADGRMDMCKQVVGPSHINELCEAVANSPPGKVRHFLLGNNVSCQGSPEIGARALASLIASETLQIETWYLAGNAITSDAVEVLARAFEKNKTANALWLKRNPLKASGAAHIGQCLTVNTSLQILDLDNTGLLDEGVAALLEPLTRSTSRCHLRHLYLNGNGITIKGAKCISRFLKTHPQALETLYLSMNCICTEGAKEIAKALLRTAKSSEQRPALKRLNLASCRITSEALPDIFEAARVCQMICVDLGSHKATRDLGEKHNRFIGDGINHLVAGVNSVMSLRCLDVEKCGLSNEHVEPLRKAANSRGDIALRDGIKEKLGVMSPVQGNVSKQELREGIRHPKEIRNIDSVYRVS